MWFQVMGYQFEDRYELVLPEKNPLQYSSTAFFMQTFKERGKGDLETDLDTVAWYLLAEVTPSWPWPHEWNWGSQAYVFI